MTAIAKLNTEYGATKEERNYVQETLDKKWVQELFTKEKNDLKNKIMRNFHTDNYVAFEMHKKFDTEKKSMKDILNTDPDMKKKYETALKNKRRWASEGIVLLQAIAINCVKILANKDDVEKKLSSRDDLKYKSQAIDGFLGPNTFYVLASIAKEKGISFNGIVDKKLLDTMMNICKEAPVNVVPTATNTIINTPPVAPVNVAPTATNTIINTPPIAPVNVAPTATTTPINTPPIAPEADTF